MTSELQRRQESEKRAAEARQRQRDEDRQRKAASRKAAEKRAYLARGGDEAAFEDAYNAQLAAEARREVQAGERQVADTIRRNF